jgi:hypothetical protein
MSELVVLNRKLHVVVAGEPRPLTEVADEIGMTYNTLYGRLCKMGLSLDEAVRRPVPRRCGHARRKYIVEDNPWLKQRGVYR